MKLVVGLGNPGKEYINTRHNVGFMCVDNYLGNVEFQEKFNALYHEIRVNGEKVLFIKPQTFMNLSGNAVISFVNYYDIGLKDVLVIQDDLDLPIGTIRIKENSSSGGHNGIKSIISCLNTQDFGRLKLGISNDKTKDTKDYVLGKFSKEEKEILDNTIIKTKDIIDTFINEGIESTIRIYNKK